MNSNNKKYIVLAALIVLALVWIIEIENPENSQGNPLAKDMRPEIAFPVEPEPTTAEVVVPVAAAVEVAPPDEVTLVVAEEIVVPAAASLKIAELPPPVHVKIADVQSFPANRIAQESGKSNEVHVLLNERPDANLKIELSQDHEFRTKTKLRSAKKKNIFVGLVPGRYFVRLNSGNRTPASVENQIVSVEIKDYEKLKPTRVYFPVANQIFVVKTADSIIPLKAHPTPEGNLYEFQVSKSLIFQESETYTYRSPRSNYHIKEKLAPGSWFYRVQVLNDDSKSDWSEPISFRVINP